MNYIFDVNENTVSYHAPNGQTRHWYHEDYSNNKNLLITIGDSWSWGDHLGAIDWNNTFDDPIRLQSVYGKKLSQMLHADWVLIANPGCSNYWMLNKLKQYSKQIVELKSKYDRIYVVVVLTEDLRECSYQSERNQIDDYVDFIKQASNLEQFLIAVEKKIFESFKSIFEDLQVNSFITRAFTDVWPDNKQIMPNYLLDKTWCDVFQDKVNYFNYLVGVPFIGQMSLQPLTNYYIPLLEEPYNEIFKQNFVELEHKLRSRWNFLGYSEYNLKGSTYHPTVEGHAVFAEYLAAKLDFYKNQ